MSTKAKWITIKEAIESGKYTIKTRAGYRQAIKRGRFRKNEVKRAAHGSKLWLISEKGLDRVYLKKEGDYTNE